MASDRIDSEHPGQDPAHPAVNLARPEPNPFPPLLIIPATRQLRHDDGRKLMLEPRMMQVLVALADANGAVLSRDDLVARCWDVQFVGDEAISSVIYRLRKSLRELAGDAIQIETVSK